MWEENRRPLFAFSVWGAGGLWPLSPACEEGGGIRKTRTWQSSTKSWNRRVVQQAGGPNLWVGGPLGSRCFYVFFLLGGCWLSVGW